MRSSLGPSQRLGTPLPLKTRHYQEWIGACDHETEQYLKAFESKVDPREGSLPESKNEQEPSDDVSRFDLGSHLHRIFGVDLTRIPGINSLTTQTLLAEISPDLSRFGSAPAFTSWLGLCPDSRVSDGKVLSVKTRKVKNRAATALRMAAQSLHRSHLRDFNASRNAGFVPAVSDLALIILAATDESLAHDGMSPQQASDSSRTGSLGFWRMTGIDWVGSML